jgi:3-phosphoshikimate 1-carboxyvinyltransferase
MQTRPIQPLNAPPQAVVRVPGSKSLTNRALLVAALAEGETRLSNALFSDDSSYFAAGLQQLGFSISLDESRSEMRVTGLGGRIPAHQARLYIGNAGTAARFLTALLTLGDGEFTLDGDPRMRQRPIGDLVKALNELGAQVASLNDPNGVAVCPPLRISANGLPGGAARISGRTSSQYLSGLLMVSPYTRQPVELLVTDGLSSKPYVDMTLRVMEDFGVQVRRQGYDRFTIQPQRYQARPGYAIESDASAASYFFAAPAICGGTVRVENISRRSVQGDIAFLVVLDRMGCRIEDTANGIDVHAPTTLRGVEVDLSDFPDTAQTLAVIAPFASSPTTIRGIASARLKESDRVAATCTELARLGVQVEEHPAGMTIYPCREFRPALIRTYNDHRMAMAFALIGLRLPGVSIENPGCVAKTFPDFFQVLESLRSSQVGTR